MEHEELKELIRQIVREVLIEKDGEQLISRSKALEILKISRYKFDRMLFNGEIKPVNKSGSGQPKFQLSQIQKIANEVD